MARTALTPYNRIQNALRAEARDLEGWLLKNKIPKTRVAELVGKTPRAVQYQFKEQSLTPDVIMAVKMMKKGKLK